MAVPTTGQTHFSSVSGGVVALLVVVLVLVSGVVDAMGVEVDASKVASVDLFVGKTMV